MDFAEREIRDYLTQLYWEKNKSMRQIAKEIGISLSSLYDMFCEYGVRTRTRKEAMKMSWKQRKIVQKTEKTLMKII